MQQMLIEPWTLVHFVPAIVIAIIALLAGMRCSSKIQQLTLRNSVQKNELLRFHEVEKTLADKENALQQLQQRNIGLEHDIDALHEIRLERDGLRSTLSDCEKKYADVKAKNQAEKASFVEIQKASAEKLTLLQETETRMQTQFENLANRIFEQKSESFAKANKTGLDVLLAPLKEQIEGFKRQVSDVYVKEGQERASLKTEILSLKALNQQITSEATALTNALKGDNKQQGNWGEVVLERILEQSGLREGSEFDTQSSHRSDEGRQLQPDVIVHLPNQKDIIIDSKVSLVGYEGFHSAQSEEHKRRYLKDHIQSIRTHIKGLSKKDYQSIKSIKTLDYVLMFIPIEPAFLLAVENDPELVNFALNSNIMLVSPTNLLVALRTVNNIWQYEYQNQNAQLIAERAAKLYDKFSGFVTDMEKLGKSLETTTKTYDAALNKLSNGKGNLLRQVENFKSMGVQPSKSLPKHLLGQDNDGPARD
jgi:DNA recombination protein RmuC